MVQQLTLIVTQREVPVKVCFNGGVRSPAHRIWRALLSPCLPLRTTSLSYTFFTQFTAGYAGKRAGTACVTSLQRGARRKLCKRSMSEAGGTGNKGHFRRCVRSFSPLPKRLVRRARNRGRISVVQAKHFANGTASPRSSRGASHWWCSHTAAPATA